MLMMIGGIVSFFQLPLSEYPAVTPPTAGDYRLHGRQPRCDRADGGDTAGAGDHRGRGDAVHVLQSATDGRMIPTITFDQHRSRHGPDPGCRTGSRGCSRACLTRCSGRAWSPRRPRRTSSWWCTCCRRATLRPAVHLELRLPPGARRTAAPAGDQRWVVWGAGEYSMRLWLRPRPDRHARGLTGGRSDRRGTRTERPGGGRRRRPGAGLHRGLPGHGEYPRAAERRRAVRRHHVRTGADGQVTRLRDVARIEMGGDAYAPRSLLDGEPAVALQIIQSPEPTRWIPPRRCVPPWRGSKATSRPA
ncbi:hypothetical protein ACPA9J_16845 [Pseudomonas aeruginosa]